MEDYRSMQPGDTAVTFDIAQASTNTCHSTNSTTIYSARHEMWNLYSLNKYLSKHGFIGVND